MTGTGSTGRKCGRIWKQGRNCRLRDLNNRAKGNISSIPVVRMFRNDVRTEFYVFQTREFGAGTGKKSQDSRNRGGQMGFRVIIDVKSILVAGNPVGEWHK